MVAPRGSVRGCGERLASAFKNGVPFCTFRHFLALFAPLSPPPTSLSPFLCAEFVVVTVDTHRSDSRADCRMPVSCQPVRQRRRGSCPFGPRASQGRSLRAPEHAQDAPARGRRSRRRRRHAPCLPTPSSPSSAWRRPGPLLLKRCPQRPRHPGPSRKEWQPQSSRRTSASGRPPGSRGAQADQGRLCAAPTRRLIRPRSPNLTRKCVSIIPRPES